MIFIDQTNSEVVIDGLPNRIISLVPSQTELLFDLGLSNEIIGITKFCIHPAEEVKKKKIIGGTKNLNIDLISSLKPDLIIGNKEENDKEQIAQLRMNFPVWLSDVIDLGSAIDMITQLGLITDKANVSNTLVNDLIVRFDNLDTYLYNWNIRVAYMIWDKPMMAVGRNNFINSMLNRIGLQNVFQNFDFSMKMVESFSYRYPMVSVDELNATNPQLIMLPDEPFPFAEKHLEKYSNLFPNSKIILVRGDYFSWYGSRLLESVNYFKNLINDIQLLTSNDVNQKSSR